jgi:hypothetical protein
VKRWHYIALAGLLVLGVGYVVLHRQELGLTGPHAIGADDSRDLIEPPSPTTRPIAIVWKKVDRTQDGFKVEMPVDVRQIQIPAYNESGGTDTVDMIFSNPDADTTFSVAWADNPPVARVSNRAPDRTLEMARDGAVARTQTTLESESANNTQGFPGRDFVARNSGGGVLNSRLVYAGSRLYMLVAAFPSAYSRRDRDGNRFFNSFTVTSPAGNGKAAPLEPAKKD